MNELTDRVAVITGAGNGIGRGMALAFAHEGMHVVVADIDAPAAEAVAAEVRALGSRALAVPTDVADRDAVMALAGAAYREFGAVNVLCNNAGVLHFRKLAEATAADWDWVLRVNLYGVINGLLAFVPRMIAQGGDRHIVNTGSVSGLIPHPGLDIGIYTTSKFAVVGLSEALRADLEPHGIGVSVLCPGDVRTRISDAGRNRQPEFGGPFHAPGRLARAMDSGMDPVEAGRLVVRGIRENRLYIQTHREQLKPVEKRHRALADSFRDAL